MNSKVQEKQEGRQEILKSLFLELKQLNPERTFLMSRNQIYVDTQKLWELQLPENSNIVVGVDREEIEKYQFMSIKTKDYYAFIYIGV